MIARFKYPDYDWYQLIIKVTQNKWIQILLAFL